jgi:hypothetical protein
MFLNPLVDYIFFPKGAAHDFYYSHAIVAACNIVTWLLYKLGRFGGLIETTGFLGERSLSCGRILMCILGPVGFFPYSPVSTVIWLPIIATAANWTLLSLLAIPVLLALEIKYFILLKIPSHRLRNDGEISK